MNQKHDYHETYFPVRGLCNVRDVRLTPLNERIKILTLFLTEKEAEVDGYSVFLFRGKKVVFVPDRGREDGTFYYIPEKDYSAIIKE